MFKGHNGDVFFFNKKSTGASSNASVENGQFDLCLQVINKKQNAERGELSRETSESCFTFRIDPDSKLFNLLMDGRFVMKKYTDIYHLNSVLSMVESDGEKYVVFSHCTKNDQGPAIYFYDVNKCKETKRVQGGEAFIDYYEHESIDDKKGRLLMLGNKEIMSDTIWSDEKKIAVGYAEMYD